MSDVPGAAAEPPNEPGEPPNEPGEDNTARKADHLRIALGDHAGFVGLTTGFEQLRVRARALPERDLDEVDLSTELWGHHLTWPLLISCMTGGTTEAGPVNRALAVAAQRHGVAVGLGSGRVLLEDHARDEGFMVREAAPDVPILANLGAAQLAEYGPDACEWLVSRCAADALVIHLNPLQEAVQPGGDTGFSGLTARIDGLARELSVPVVVKEVGFGLAPEDIELLAGSGVAGIDVAGAGGTNWARIEGQREDEAGAVAAAFTDWGWPTTESVRVAHEILGPRRLRTVYLIASGGVRDGVDALKALCLGADLVGVARGLLSAAVEGPEAADRAVGVIARQLQVAAWAAGAGRVDDLESHLLR
ncbi:type 2 isopentenyl-diphosphate Delta-isomerase [Egibacter rhizosphaerae]|uniref:Isopentenyl-diphosphate delta-isomerase n=1 Tax=Egibacter rhizosphaerae TaxID=1670831 RepID=A0A411YCW6_9ACTN|nr:type 2 isopentenyl-diphosphate Delta-isomerase [Egibacter rhizosphaerae]QBI19040.1 type 2 isopentenyl-diphosphate Delta-isomerase [Egibacter rhizosphaerae]